jgi:MoaA/NifB/PqqE/SkfB family radical SAM enzyme|tara:strand:+ start:2640 stop:3548 length:909 start_codon:yes stop_codon:yes gene_type:complete
MVSFHIEPTSKCTLECPLCDRTWLYETFKKRNLHEINIEHLVNFVGVNADVQMCGNNGDPIYHSDFLNLCKSLKDNNCKISIVTNGSAKTKKWWSELNNMLDENDTITFSIDGLEDTNHLYRKNAKWKSIMNAVKIFADRKCRTEWKYIVFKHNQHQIKDAKELSTKLGFDHFRLEHSDRWLGKKDLMPDREFVDTYYQQQQKVLIDQNYKADMQPYCLIKNKPAKALYIDAEGDFYPCCWMATYRYKFKSLFSPKQKQFNIEHNSLDGILNNEEVKKFFDSTNQFTSAHDCCKIQCGVKNG